MFISEEGDDVFFFLVEGKYNFYGIGTWEYMKKDALDVVYRG